MRRRGYVPHVHYHAHPGVEGHEHEHPLTGHHYAPFGNRVIEVEEPSLVLLLKRSIEEAEAAKRDR